MKGKGGRDKQQHKARNDDDEDDPYMRRIRARAEAEPDSDEYSGAEEEEEEEGGSEGAGSSSSEEEEGFEPGRGYDTEEESDGGSSAEDEEEDEYAQERREALAAVRSLPLAERLALMASGAMHDEGSGLATGRRRRQRRQGLEAAEGDGAKGTGTKKEKEGEDALGLLAKPKNKHAPTEVSSKKPVPRLRALTALPPAAPTGGGRRRKARDPRFDPALGKVNYEQFRQAYGFLEGYQEKEVQALQAAMKKAKSQSKKEELKTAMNAIRQERSERERADRARAVARKTKREERAKVAAGKSPFFLKKREKRRLELEDRYEQLAKEGKLERALAKKRRRNAAKDHRWLPHARRTAASAGEGGVGGGV